MKKKKDLRVLRSQKMIVSAFMKLVAEKGYSNVSVQDIADEAMINRATFYAHFKDKDDLFESIFTRYLTVLTSVLDVTQLIKGNKIQVRHIEHLLTEMYDVVDKNRPFFKVILSGNSQEIFREKLAKIVYEKYIDIFAKLRITENEVEIPIGFVIEYMSAIYISTMHWWINNDSDMTSAQLATLVVKLIGNGHLTVMGIEIER